MSLISLEYLLFILALLVVYYLVPKRFQWVVLLAASMVFYCWSGFRNVLFILFTAATTYGGALLISRMLSEQKEYLKQNKAGMTREEKNRYKEKCTGKRRWVLGSVAVVNLAVLCISKNLPFAAKSINSLLGYFGGGQVGDAMSFIVPLGISFYTLQSIGYLADVYWGKVTAERNFAKMLLFVSFFPQIVQGPISTYSQLSAELFAEHSFSYRAYSRGFTRLFWGLFKKMVVANILSPYVLSVYKNYGAYSGLTVFIGIILHTLQLYADFSGYMDISCGVCDLLGITLPENFNLPLFSKSLSEFWRRWHITLGAWFKNYVFFPIATSKWNSKLSSSAQKRFGKYFGQSLMATVPLVAVWICTGLWHDLTLPYLVWGCANGAIIIFSLWMKPVYAKCTSALRIKESGAVWNAFRCIRTVLIFSFIDVLPEVGTLAEGFGLWKRVFTDFSLPHSFRELFPFVEPTTMLYCSTAALGLAGMLAVSLIKRKSDVRDRFAKIPMPVRAVALGLLFVVIAVIGVRASIGQGGFMYENF